MNHWIDALSHFHHFLWFLSHAQYKNNSGGEQLSLPPSLFPYTDLMKELLQAQWLSRGSSIRGCLPSYTAIPTIFTIFTSNSYCCATFREGSQTSPSPSLQEISTKMFHQKIGQVGTKKATNLRTALPSSLFLWRRECQRQLSEPLLLFIK